jgi:hypothetical protein
VEREQQVLQSPARLHKVNVQVHQLLILGSRLKGNHEKTGATFSPLFFCQSSIIAIAFGVQEIERHNTNHKQLMRNFQSTQKNSQSHSAQSGSNSCLWFQPLETVRTHKKTQQPSKTPQNQDFRIKQKNLPASPLLRFFANQAKTSIFG